MKTNLLDNNRYLEILEDPWYHLLVELQNIVSYETYSYWSKKGLKTMHLPITSNTISSPMGLGSDSQPVMVNLFGQETYLADSMQFMLEYGCRFFNRGAYYIMPSFRGESADKRHLCQFYHSEIEIPGSMNHAIAYAEEYLKHLCIEILNKLGKNLSKIVGGISHIKEFINKCGNIPLITFDEAVIILNNDPSYILQDSKGHKKITTLGEKELMDNFEGFVWLTHPDHISVPFYQAFDCNNNNKALAADLLFGIGETVGLGQRHIDAQETIKALNLHEVSVDEYRWYVEMKDQRPMLTSGFGMGIERFLMWIMKHEDIRDLQILPRFNGVSIEP